MCIYLSKEIQTHVQVFLLKRVDHLAIKSVHFRLKEIWTQKSPVVSMDKLFLHLFCSVENAYTHPSYSDLGVTPFVTPSSCPWAELNTFIQGRYDLKKK